MGCFVNPKGSFPKLDTVELKVEVVNSHVNDADKRLSSKIDKAEKELKEAIKKSQEDTIEALSALMHPGYNMHEKRIRRIRNLVYILILLLRLRVLGFLFRRFLKFFEPILQT